MGFVYCIGENPGGLVKVGYSLNPKKRLSKIQSDSPVELKIIGVISGDLETEDDLHARFSQYRVRGEWFRDTNNNITDFFGPIVKEVIEIVDLKSWLKFNNINQKEFAKIIDTSQAHVSQMISREKTPSLELAFKIQSITNGHVLASSWVKRQNFSPPSKSSDVTSSCLVKQSESI